MRKNRGSEHNDLRASEYFIASGVAGMFPCAQSLAVSDTGDRSPHCSFHKSHMGNKDTYVVY
jgi:hypothetical protein